MKTTQASVFVRYRNRENAVVSGGSDGDDDSGVNINNKLLGAIPESTTGLQWSCPMWSDQAINGKWAGRLIDP